MAAKGDDTKQQALIISLVFFVILSIGLGVSTYYGFAGQKDIDDRYKKEKTDKDAKVKSRDWEQFQNLTLKAYLGAPMSQEDKDGLVALRGQYDGSLGKDEKNYEEFKGLLATLNQKMGWNETNKLPRATYFEKVEKLETETKDLNAKLKKAEEQYAKAKDEFDANLKATIAEKEVAVKDLAAAKKDLADTIPVKSAEFNELTKQKDNADQEADTLKRAALKKEEETKKETAKRNEEMNKLKISNARFKEQTAPIDPTGSDPAKGYIVRLDSRGAMAYINLGSEDNVKPGLTFSVFHVGLSGKREGQRKGAIEVVQVLQPHLSMARITDQTNAGKDPIGPNDSLFNPSWSPDQRQHIALTGVIDLTGDGRDDSQELIRNLERQGIVVDSYLNLKDMSVKGPGMSPRTNYLVVGDQPDYGESVNVGSGDLASRRQELMTKMTDTRTEAINMNVSILPLNRFLAQIGYRLPKKLGGTSNFQFGSKPGANLDKKDSVTEGTKDTKTDKAPAKDKKDSDDKDK